MPSFPLGAVAFCIKKQTKPSMTSIRKSEVPQFLRGSEYFQALGADDDDQEFFVPLECFMMSPEITDESTFQTMVSTLRFWGVSPFSDCERKINFVKKEFGSNEFQGIASHFQNELNSRGERGSRKLVQYLVNQGGNLSEYTLCIITTDCSVCRLEYFNHYVLSAKEKVDSMSAQLLLSSFASSAARGANVSALRSLHEMGTVLNPSLYVDATSCISQSLECLQYLLSNKVLVTPSFITSLADQDKCDALACVLSHGHPIPSTICKHLRSIECVDVLHEAGYKWTEWSGFDAIGPIPTFYQIQRYNARGPVISHILAHLCSLGCYMPPIAKTIAIYERNINTLIALHQHGCKWDAGGKCIQAAIDTNQQDIVEFALSTGSNMPRLYSYDKYDPYGNSAIYFGKGKKWYS